MKINEIMAVDVEALDPGASVEEAAQLMSDADIGGAPIVEAGRVLGMVTDRDIVVRAVAEGLDASATKVVDIMTPEVIHCYEEDEVEEAARLMSENQVRRILVLDRDDRLAGIVALADLATETEEAAAVLEEISQPSEELGGGARNDSRIEPLVRGELSAVETYKQALDKVGGVGGNELRRIESDHEKAAQLLEERMKRLGEEPPASSGLWGAWSKAVEGTAKAFGRKAAIKALKEGEEHGIHDYENALKDEALDPEVKALIRTTLLPQTRAHIPVLDRVLQGAGA